jgi:hypothetical protein
VLRFVCGVEDEDAGRKRRVSGDEAGTKRRQSERDR